MRIQSLLCQKHYRLLVLGGGASGCAVASKFSRILQPNQVAVVEPNTKHYYQPGFTFVGSGIFKLENLIRNEENCLSKKVILLKDSVFEFSPQTNEVQLKNIGKISYDYLVIATGLELRYDLIDGLTDDILLNAPGVCSIYSPKYVEKVSKEATKLKYGNALFTYPNTPIKCGGAPQKIMYLLEEQLNKDGRRSNVNFIYNTSLGQVFSIAKYSNELIKIINTRNIQLNLRHNLIKIDAIKQIATFEILNDEANPTGKTKDFKYSFLHVAPPCSPIKALRETQAKNLVNTNGWVAVNSETLQNDCYKNIFGIGDCVGLTAAKTAAAVSSQSKILSENLKLVLKNKAPVYRYDGYSSCPIVIDSKHVILAEFNNAGPLETFPFDQSKPSKIAFWMKRYFMPILYWKFLIKGLWNGPATISKFFALFKPKNNN